MAGEQALPAPRDASGAASTRLSLGALFWLNSYWFATAFHWGALLTIVIPAEVLRFVPESQKGSYLGLLFGVGAAVAMVVTPLAGALSDRALFRMGRRRPFMIAGTLLNCAALLWMRSAPSYGWFLAAYLAVQASDNTAAGAFHGLIPDKVPPHQRGVASALMGFLSMVATSAAVLLAGTLVGRGQTRTVYPVIIAVMLLYLLLTLWKVKETPQVTRPALGFLAFLRSFWINPRQYPDFGWLFLTRALVMLGFYTLIGFLQFFVKDTLGLTTAQAASLVGRLSVLVVGAALVAAVAGGVISDRYGRRGIVSIAGFFLALTCVGLLFQPGLPVLTVIAVLLGIGTGAYTSVDWALAIDVLPSRLTAAKDLGIWGIANTLPQVAAPLLAGPLLDVFNRIQPNFGYTVVYSLAIVYTFFGSVFVWKIKGAR